MARRKDTSAPPAPESLPYEEAIAELEAIIERIEQGEIGLEESLRQFERGDALVRRCDAVLRDAEQKVEQIDRARLASLGDAAAAAAGDSDGAPDRHAGGPLDDGLDDGPGGGVAR